ncbi:MULTISPECIES: hypothetical protein [unclassified Flavobacterium]|uniref:hypothetical protein n=1 Tax=unclassified Flavobacterium TaxID=196869 RepID=UPI001F12F09C|nr:MULTISPECIES: hypothetical protein [unclassified Flavobacterium]UMY66722.1 hypothetical protein MKO97_04880 [Flavobacterium sp. HJ-32-4]
MGILSFFRTLLGGTPESKPSTATKTRDKKKAADEVAEITARTRQQIKSTSMRHASKKTNETREEDPKETVSPPKPKKRKPTPARKTDPAAKVDTSATSTARKPKPRKRKPKPTNPSDDTVSGS